MQKYSKTWWILLYCNIVEMQRYRNVEMQRYRDIEKCNKKKKIYRASLDAKSVTRYLKNRIVKSCFRSLDYGGQFHKIRQISTRYDTMQYIPHNSNFNHLIPSQVITLYKMLKYSHFIPLFLYLSPYLIPPIIIA